VGSFVKDGVTYLNVKDKNGWYHVYAESLCEQLS